VRQRLVATAIAAVILGGGVLLLSRTTPAAPPAPAAAISTGASDWVLPRLDGSGAAVSVADFRGHPLVVNFFASWCDPCRAELPLLAQAARDLQGQVGFVGVNSEETGDGLAMARDHGIGEWVLAADSGGANQSGLHDALGGRGMPITAFYDSNGRLLKVQQGAFSSLGDLRAEIRRVLGAG
jgi:cytochrome c biogenesis protein CcmG/thiol:disulfide interchange protein DsbE